MTDEIKQKVSDYAVPGLVTGAVLGAAGGVAGAHYNNWGVSYNKPDLDKVFAQTPDEFTSMAKRAGDNRSNIEKAAEIVKGVQNLESKYDEKIAELQKTGGVTDADLPKDMVYRRNNAQEALDRIIEQEKAKYSSAGKGIDSSKFLAFDKINTADLPTVHAKSGKPLKGNEVKTLYNDLTNEVKKAETALESSLASGLRTDKKTYSDLINDALKDVNTDLAGKTDEQVADYFAEKTKGSWRFKRYTDQYKRAVTIADKYYPIPTTLTNEEFLQIGTELKPGETAPRGTSTKVVTYTNEKGRVGYKTVYFDDKTASELLKNKKEQVRELRTAAADQIFAEQQRAYTISRDITNLPAKVEKEVPIDKAKATGLYTPASGGSPDKLDINKIIKEGEGIQTYTVGKTTYKGYAADMKRLEEAIRTAKATGTTAIIPTTGMNSTFGTGVTAEEALKQLQERNSIYKSYIRQLKALNKELESSKTNNPIIREINEKIAEKYTTNKRLIKAKAALAEQFPNLFGETEALTEEEIANRLKESQAIKNAEAKVNAVKDEIAKYAEEKGLKSSLTLDEAVKKFGKTKEEFVKSTKEEAKTKLETLFKDVKFANKTWTGLAAAAVVGLVGLGIGSTMKKNS